MPRGFLIALLVLTTTIYTAPTCVAEEITLSLDPPVLEAPSRQPQHAPQPAAKQPSVAAQTAKVGRVGIVDVDKAAIYGGRSTSSRKYASVKAETPLAIVKEEGEWYGVLMVNGATGWINRSCVRMTGYDLVSSAPRRGPAVSRGTAVSHMDAAGDAIIRTALQYSGVRYVFGGVNPSTGMDCSAFVRSVFSQFSVGLPRTARAQAQVGATVPFDQLKPGDRLYFSCKNPYVDHCGIYAGNGYFVHCSSSRGGVAVDSLASDFYWRSLVAAKRS